MDPDPRRRSRLTFLVCAVTGLYWLAIFAATHWPIVPLPGPPFGSSDKVEHLGAFAGLAFLLSAAAATLGIAPRRAIAAVFAMTAVYGIFDEVTQAFVPYRTPDFQDWIADLLGAGLGITAYSIAHELWLLALRRR
jgi:VanZ family protein